LPILPASVADAQSRAAAAYNHLDVYAYDLFSQSGALEVEHYLSPANYSGSLGHYGATSISPSADAAATQQFLTLQNSHAGREIDALSKELALYGAIAEVGERNAKFREAYDQNPEQAAKDYATEIASRMNSVKMPFVYTKTNDDRMVNGFGFTLPGNIARQTQTIAAA
jgi:hypothetical protein